MIGLPEIAAGAMLGALLLYAVLGGADFGGGMWDFVARGPRGRAQQELIDRAITPVWEANHVWLVLIVVVLFTAFPPAFAAASTLLHVPLSLMLIGIVFRGSGFVFSAHAPGSTRVRRRWDRVFSVSSFIAPFFLGVCLGAASSGRLDGAKLATDSFAARFVHPWLEPFPILVGAFAVAIFAFVAAVYLTIEASDPALRGDFRRRALAAAVASAVLAAATAACAASTQAIASMRPASGWLWAVVAAAAVAWLGAVRALWVGRYRLARMAAVAFVACVLVGWAIGQYPFLVRPGITIRSAAAPDATLRALVIALAAGSLVLFPSLYWLLRVFKGRAVFGKD